MAPPPLLISIELNAAFTATLNPNTAKGKGTPSSQPTVYAHPTEKGGVDLDEQAEGITLLKLECEMTPIGP